MNDKLFYRVCWPENPQGVECDYDYYHGKDYAMEFAEDRQGRVYCETYRLIRSELIADFGSKVQSFSPRHAAGGDGDGPPGRHSTDCIPGSVNR